MEKILIILITVFFFINCSIAQEVSKHDKRTPFEAVKYIDDDPYILVDNEWVKIHAIAGVTVSRYINLAVEYNPRNWKMGFLRWMHYMFDELEIERDSFIMASYYKDSKVIDKLFELKVGNRDLATSFHDSIDKVRYLEREHTEIIQPSLDYLTQRIYKDSIDQDYWVSKIQVDKDLDFLECEMIENYSYLNLQKYNFQLGLDAIRNGIGEGIDKRDFALQLKMFLANFGDGHTRVSFSELGFFQNLPFRIIKHGDSFYAIDPNTKSFYMGNYPELKSINGVDIKVLFETSRRLIAKTTDGFIESNALSYMRYIELILKLESVEVKGEVDIEFFNSEMNLVLETKVAIGEFHLPSLKLEHILYDSIITGQIGYLAFNSKMIKEEYFIDGLHDAMSKLSETQSLIIDIRGNGGGSRDALINLMPYFIKKPTVLNVGRYRIDFNPNLKPSNGFLERRFMYPTTADDETLNDKADAFIKCIKEFNVTFRPENVVSDSLFSEYHYMVAYPSDDKKIKYDKPVIVLVDEDCFSASDIFAAGIKQAPNVKLMGNITGGGSGYANSKRLPYSNISVRLSRMFSYQPNGQNYDGVGVEPDIRISKSLFDKMGKTDSQLDSAIQYLENSMN